MSDSPPSSRKRQALLALGALGVVFGDIGTSPLYALRESLVGHDGHKIVEATSGNVTGILSLIIWALISLISLKYLTFVMRADNDGEGGMLSLLALGFPGPVRAGRTMTRRSLTMVVLAILGTSFLFGEGIITPAISVLSAVEGLKVAVPGINEHLIPAITIAILLALFSVQSRGTGKVGAAFGPITLVWFLTIGVLGITGIMRNPEVLKAFSPHYGLEFLLEHQWRAALTLGGVFLVVTGGEALYADMGHFGRRPIRLAWFTVVLPCLLLNYLGQGALILERPEVAYDSPFHRLAPGWFALPLTILGAMAAVIASQALISGAFSLAMQGVQMGFMPRLPIVHTSEQEAGQIYIGPVNWAIMIGSILLVLGFKTSTNLAAAYGIAVSLTMFITTILLTQVAGRRWHWPAWKIWLICGTFGLIELGFIAANLTKVAQGGWVPLVIGATLLYTMLTWKRGRTALARKFSEMSLPLEDLVESLQHRPPARVRGTAVYLSTGGNTPSALLHNLKHNQVLHKKVIILTINSARVPRVPPDKRIKTRQIGMGIWRVEAKYGFMQQPDVPSVLRGCTDAGLICDAQTASFFLGRETIIPTRKNLPLMQARFFAFLSRSSQSAMDFFKLPPNRVIELGAQIEL